MVCSKVIDLTVGILSTVILASLLTAEDFGLISLTVSIIAVLGLIGDFGTESGHYDAIWSFNAAFGIALGMLVAAIA